MALDFGFAIENARCFRRTDLARVSPGTFLVGENSSGKSSFFALLNEGLYFFDVPRVDIDRSPFDLGSLSDLIHRDKHSRVISKYFTLRFSFSIEGDGIGALAPTVSITYGESLGERIIREVSILLGDKQVTLTRNDKTYRISARIGGRSLELQYLVRDSHAWKRQIYGAFIVTDVLTSASRFLSTSKVEAGDRFRLSSQARESAPAFAALISEAVSALQAGSDYFRWLVRSTEPIRSAPQRVYFSTGGGRLEREDRVPFTLRQIKLYQPDRWNKLHKELVTFGRTTGLYSEIDVEPLRARRRDGPFEIMIETGGVKSNIKDVGYGVSQAIPFFAELMIDQDQFGNGHIFRGIMTYIQQPEIHLHPSAQAAIGSFLFDYVHQSGRRVIVETHSDFIIDRVRQRIRKDSSKQQNFSLLFFDKSDDSSYIHSLRFDGMGNVLDAPPNYREFFLHEELANLGE